MLADAMENKKHTHHKVPATHNNQQCKHICTTQQSNNQHIKQERWKVSPYVPQNRTSVNKSTQGKCRGIIPPSSMQQAEKVLPLSNSSPDSLGPGGIVRVGYQFDEHMQWSVI